MIRSRVVAVAAAVSVLVGLSGCAESRAAGQSASHAEIVVDRLPGVHHARANLRHSMDGFTKRITLSFTIDLEPGFEVADQGALADYLVRSLWSISDTRPPVWSSR